MATTWLVRTTGNDNNGGTSASVRSTGTDGVTNGTNTLTSASASWTSADIGHGIFIGGVNQWRTIATVPSGTSLTFSGATIASASGRTWTIGGAFLTINKSFQIAADGDTSYVGAGTYREQVTSMAATPTVETKWLADRDGSKTGDAGNVVWTCYLTNDTSAPASTNANLATGGKNHITLQDFIFVGSTSGTASSINFGAGQNLIVRRCAFLQWSKTTGGASIIWTATANVNANVLIDQCYVWTMSPNLITASLPLSATADYACGLTVQNCEMAGMATNAMIETNQVGGSGTNKGGGVVVINCTCLTGGVFFRCNGTNLSTTSPSTMTGCFVACGSANGSGAVLVTTSGQLTGSYNLLIANTLSTNYVLGTGDVYQSGGTSAYSFMMELGQNLLWPDMPSRPYGTPMVGSPLIGFANTGSLVVDATGRIRPTQNAIRTVGALERHDTAVQVASPVHGSAGHSWQFTGPGDHQFDLPVDAATIATTSVWVQYDANYGAGTKPQALLTNGGGIGVADQTLTLGAIGAATWGQLTFSSYTPTAKGVVSIRFISAAAATGVVTFSDFAP